MKTSKLHLPLKSLHSAALILFFLFSCNSELKEDYNEDNKVNIEESEDDEGWSILKTKYGQEYFQKALMTLMTNNPSSLSDISKNEHFELLDKSTHLYRQMNKASKAEIESFAKQHLSQIHEKMRSAKIPINSNFTITKIQYFDEPDTWCAPAVERMGVLTFKVKNQTYKLNFKRVFVFSEDKYMGIEFRVPMD